MTRIKISAALERLVRGSTYTLGQMPWDESVLDTVGFFQLTGAMSNWAVLKQPRIGDLAEIHQSALSLEQAAHILAFQHDLQENLIPGRNRGFALIDGKVYEVRMDFWRYQGNEIELTLDITDLDEATWHMGSRVFYNTKPRDQLSTPATLSMSVAREIFLGIRADEVDARGEFPLLVTA